MDLEVFLDRWVLVQFKQPYIWMVPGVKNDRVEPVVVPVPGQPPSAPGQRPEMTFLTVPFLAGKVKVLKGEPEGMCGDRFVLRIADQQNGMQIDVMLATDMIFSVSAVSADQIRVPEGNLIIAP